MHELLWEVFKGDITSPLEKEYMCPLADSGQVFHRSFEQLLQMLAIYRKNHGCCKDCLFALGEVAKSNEERDGSLDLSLGSLLYCVTWKNLLNLSEPCFPHH